MQHSNVLFRGNILRVTSKINRNSNAQINADYYIERVAMDRDRDLMNNPVGPVRYAYNLFNVKNGAARVSKRERLFVSTQDGIAQGIPLHLIEQHFELRFKKISDARLIKDEVTHLLDEEEKKANRSAVVTALGATLVGLIGALALTDNGRTANIQH